jgi:hypothetical protein
MGETSLRKRSIIIFFSLLAVLVSFQNCSSPTASDESSQQELASIPENYLWLEEPVPQGLNKINYFTTTKPLDMVGFDGYRYIYSQYFVNRCTKCHLSPTGFLPHFGTTPLTYSYEIAKKEFYKPDVLVRVTNNPHCPECTLNTKGEVYQAIRYWLDHR